jgi:hypothetical protein
VEYGGILETSRFIHGTFADRAVLLLAANSRSARTASYSSSNPQYPGSDQVLGKQGLTLIPKTHQRKKLLGILGLDLGIETKRAIGPGTSARSLEATT